MYEEVQTINNKHSNLHSGLEKDPSYGNKIDSSVRGMGHVVQNEVRCQPYWDADIWAKTSSREGKEHADSHHAPGRDMPWSRTSRWLSWPSSCFCTPISTNPECIKPQFLPCSWSSKALSSATNLPCRGRPWEACFSCTRKSKTYFMHTPVSAGLN